MMLMSFNVSFLEKYQKEFDEVCKTLQQQSQVLTNSIGNSIICVYSFDLCVL